MLQRCTQRWSQKPYDRIRVCEHTLKIYDNGSCMQSIKGSHGQRLSRRLTSHWPRLSASLARRRETGEVKVKTIPGRPSKKGAALQAGLRSQLEAYPDATLAEHCQHWETSQSVQVSSATISRAIQRLDWTRKKKTLRASEQKEADRAAWREQAQTLDASKLVFLDECGSTIALTRLYGRSPKGTRACGVVPRNRRANITLLAALSRKANG
jgi:transposase